MKRNIANRVMLTTFLITLFIGLGVSTQTSAADRSGVEDFVTRFYQLCLDRAPDHAGLDGWVSGLIDGSMTGGDVAIGFVFSQEFLKKDITDEEYLQILYEAFFNRQSDLDGLQGWLDALASGSSRQDILKGFIFADEFAELCDQYGIKAFDGHFSKEQRAGIEALVTRFYNLCLERDPDSDGLRVWTDNLLSQAQTAAEVAYGFIYSPEFIEKERSNWDFLRILYSAFFDREPDSAGWDAWLSALNDGLDRLEVLMGFIFSQEFEDLCRRLGIKGGGGDGGGDDGGGDDGGGDGGGGDGGGDDGGGDGGGGGGGGDDGGGLASAAWVRIYSSGLPEGIDAAAAVAVDSEDNVYVTGTSKGNGTGFDYVTIKFDKNGNQQWVARYNGPGNDDDTPEAIVVDNAQNVYVTGASTGSGFFQFEDFATVKYDRDGNELWVARYDAAGLLDFANAIAIDDSGNVYVTGSSMVNDSSLDYATVKYNSDGLQIWVGRYEGRGDDTASAIALDSVGNIYVTGASEGSKSSEDFATVKYTKDGAQQWVRRYDASSKSDVAIGIAVDGMNDIIVTGVSDGSETSSDYATVKYDNAGNELWVARYEGPGNSQDDVKDIAVDNLNNVYVTGIEGNSAIWNIDTWKTNSGYRTVKYDSSGAQQWAERYDGPAGAWDSANAIAVDSEGNAYVTGQSRGNGTKSDFATVKYGPGGKQLWVERYDSGSGADDGATDIAIDSAGDVLVTGTTNLIKESEITTIKYDQ